MALIQGSQSFFQRLWRGYEHQLQKRPVATQSATSALLWGAGDLLAQKFSEKGRPIDVRRTALTSAFGGACIGPCGHLWYSHLDKLAVLFGPEASARWLLGKIFLDSTLWNVFYMSAFFLWGEVVIDRGNLKTFAEQMQEEFVPTYLAEVAAWPPIMAAIFTRLPVSHHLLAVNLVTVLDVAFLAIIRSGSFTLSDFLPAQLGHLQEDGEGSHVVQPQPQQPAGQPQPQQLRDVVDFDTSLLLLPALASMHSNNRAKACPTLEETNSAFGRVASVIETWVLPEYRESGLLPSCLGSSSSSSSSNSRATLACESGSLLSGGRRV